MGKVYYDMGFLSSTEVVECSASDFIGRFVGHTGPKTKAKLDEALGKVLFVDEAYRLADEGGYTTEAVNELVYLLSTPEYVGKIVVILAGHTEHMDELMTARPTLSGLFPDEINFKNIPAPDCLTLLDRELEQKRTSAPFLKDTSSSGYIQLLRMVRALSLIPSWSNARDIKILAKDMSSTATRSKSVTGGHQRHLSAKQAFECTKKMLVRQLARGSKQGNSCRKPLSTKSTQAANQACENDPPITAMDVVQNTPQLAKGAPYVPIKPVAPSQSPLTQLGDASIVREEGVSDAVWEQLQVDKEIQESRLAKAGREERRKHAAIQKKLQEMGLCPAGFEWIENSTGYVCSAGGHSISHEQLDC